MEIILIIALIVAIALWIFTKITSTGKIKNLVNENEELKKTAGTEKKHFQEQVDDLKKKNTELSKYQLIIDVEERAKEIIATADREALNLMDQAKKEEEKAINNAKEIRSEASKEAQNLKLKGESILNEATLNGQKIIDNANKRAEEIAGDAYKAMQNAKDLEKTAKAMKNIIEGYGDKYLMPTYTLLDELAEEFGHEEAGNELKRVREQVRLMIKNGIAGKCDYVEANRRETAINFVVDAFNGKVDSLLASVKRDNYGTLSQKIKDAFQVVNFNGQAFRNAVISEEYLNLRLEELKWAVAVNELKWQEKEEQRLIKDKIREEEKARKEYEKALKDAEKEEEMLKKAIEKAQKEVAQATEAQKAKYEEKLIELHAKLKFAEEKSQRAISMAQQTKAGNVYIISNIGSFGEDVFKIGMTRRLEPLDRVKELGDASVPFEFDVHSLIYSEDAPALERELHKKFVKMQMNKVNPKKEFFRISIKDIREELEKMEIDAKWTITAEAREYRESLAIEKAIASDVTKQQEWLRHQENALVSADNEVEEIN